MNAAGLPMAALDVWREIFGFLPGSGNYPDAVIALLALLAIYFFAVLPSGWIISFLDRKLSADLQARVGPQRVGLAGLLQPIADQLKLLQKSRGARNPLWLTLQMAIIYSTIAALPLGSSTLLVDTDMSVFIPFWGVITLALGSMLLGFSEETVPGWLSGSRIAAQALAGVFPALIAILCAGLRAGSFRWSELAAAQGPLAWAALTNPFQLASFGVFTVSGMVLLSIPPLDAGLSFADIQGGIASHLSGARLSVYRLTRFYGFFLWCIVASVLYLGAWRLPDGLHDPLVESHNFILLQALEGTCLLLKAFVLMLAMIWVARVNPRSRVDQVTDFSWKVLSPIALAALLGSAIWAGARVML